MEIADELHEATAQTQTLAGRCYNMSDKAVVVEEAANAASAKAVQTLKETWDDPKTTSRRLMRGQPLLIKQEMFVVVGFYDPSTKKVGSAHVGKWQPLPFSVATGESRCVRIGAKQGVPFGDVFLARRPRQYMLRPREDCCSCPRHCYGLHGQPRCLQEGRRLGMQAGPGHRIVHQAQSGLQSQGGVGSLPIPR